MTYTLLSATSSPYARKVRIALLEKGIPFTLKTEVPGHEATETKQYNPLEERPSSAATRPVPQNITEPVV